MWQVVTGWFRIRMRVSVTQHFPPSNILRRAGRASPFFMQSAAEGGVQTRQGLRWWSTFRHLLEDLTLQQDENKWCGIFSNMTLSEKLTIPQHTVISKRLMMLVRDAKSFPSEMYVLVWVARVATVRSYKGLCSLFGPPAAERRDAESCKFGCSGKDFLHGEGYERQLVGYSHISFTLFKLNLSSYSSITV